MVEAGIQAVLTVEMMVLMVVGATGGQILATGEQILAMAGRELWLTALP
ncbi:hypothetical protein SOASR030_31680 [Leminorella grimontii]|uniref:Uncharacterized protein n=1 Tax=Leminorella grimontii TaxID=82981 RepID=A0AAV5N4L8_9GAMM|nr:hypothetical protein SOASR030_31680 [Leminorella grimontii]